MNSLINQKYLRDTLHMFGFYTKKNLGQNYLINSEVLEKIVSAAQITKDDFVVEIGPGPGVLTQQLIKSGARIEALEVDKTVIPILKFATGNADNLTIFHKSALEYEPEKPGYILCANIPYYLTSPILRHYLGGKIRPKTIVFLMQKEVAQKVCSRIGDESVLSLQVRIYGKPEIIDHVNRESFFPKPNVDSSILKITVFAKPLIKEEDIVLFWDIVHHCFTEKRKKILNTFSKYRQMGNENAKMIFEKALIDPNIRPQVLTIDDWNNLIKVYREFF